MLFNSLVFLIFGAVFFLFWWKLKKKSTTITWGALVFFSFIFYGWWDWRFLFLIIFSGLIDYFSAWAIYKKPGHKKLFLGLSLLGNLGSLGVFKYSSFLLGEAEKLLSAVGVHVELTANFPDFFMILPVGISFYTFQSMSYTIDVYKGEIKPVKNVLHFFAYLSMFPQLVAGPIVRARSLLPQLLKPRKTTELERWHGTKLIAFGFFKKVLLADNIAPLVNSAFNNVHQTGSSVYWWVVIVGFAIQIYCDFSGYSDIARGLAKWMGFHFKMNFNHPYRALSMREFWQRWHISLSTWFRDYVYIPLGGSRKGKFRSHINLWITMVISGFWHGASFNFIVWGALHAFYSSFERVVKWPEFLKKYRLKYLAGLLVMFQVLLAWVFFRAETIGDSFKVIGDMLSFNSLSDFSITDEVRNGFYYILIFIAGEYGFQHIRLNRLIRNKKVLWGIEVFLIALLVMVTIYFRGIGNEFIYFRF